MKTTAEIACLLACKEVGLVVKDGEEAFRTLKNRSRQMRLVEARVLAWWAMASIGIKPPQIAKTWGWSRSCVITMLQKNKEEMQLYSDKRDKCNRVAKKIAYLTKEL